MGVGVFGGRFSSKNHITLKSHEHAYLLYFFLIGVSVFGGRGI